MYGNPPAPEGRVRPGRLRPVALSVAAGVALIAVGAVAVVHGFGPAGLAGLIVLLAVSQALTARMRAPEYFGVVVVLILLVPARLGFPALNSAGSPIVLLGLASLFAWLLGVVAGRPRLAGKVSGIRWALLGVVVTTMASYVAAGFRMPDQLELRGVDRGLVVVVSVLGLGLLAAEVFPDRDSLRRMVAAIVSATAVVAAVGVVQFMWDIDLAGLVRIPGATAMPYVEDSRSGFTRIISTVSHPIELSVVLVMVWPLALWLFFGSTGRARKWWATCTVLIVAAVPMTVSRTGIVGLVVALAVLVPTWTRRRRKRFAFAGLIGLVGLRGVIPGLVGTLRGLVLNTNDSSLLSRQVGRQRAMAAIVERPWFGRGLGTFLPQRYGFIDNQILTGAVEVGVVGTLAYALLFGVAAILGLQARRYARGARREEDRTLAVALLAGLAASASSWATHDSLSFPTERALTFVMIGLAGALWRLVRADQPDAGGPVATDAETHPVPEDEDPGATRRPLSAAARSPLPE